MDITETGFWQYARDFFSAKGRSLDNRYGITHHNPYPLDSVDRIYALYLIEKKPHLLSVSYGLLSGVDLDEFTAVGHAAYDNYEREWMSEEEVWDIIVRIASLGYEKTLENAYGETYDGWFGAS